MKKKWLNASVEERIERGAQAAGWVVIRAAAENGDTVVIDFVDFYRRCCDGEGETFSQDLDQVEFIPGFEDQWLDTQLAKLLMSL